MTEKRFLGYGRQQIDDDDIAAVTAVLRSDYLTQGPTVERFECALAEYVGARYVVAVSSGTAALHIACLAAGLKPGSLGMTSALTFIASANAVRYCGADVALADIDREGLGISKESFSRALGASPQAEVIIPVHFGGLAFQSAELRQISGARTVIEDSCHALGGKHENGDQVGSCAYADMSIFSFHPVKSITTAEGGAVTTNNKDIYNLLRRLRNHGIERDPKNFKNFRPDGALWYYEQHELGFNYRMSDLQAALGLSQLTKLDKYISRRREIALHYDRCFSGMMHVRIPQSKPEMRQRSAHHLYTVCIDFEAAGTSREAVMENLKRNGIGSQVHYVPVYSHPYYQNQNVGDETTSPMTATHYLECLSLPIHAGLTNEEVERVVTEFQMALA